FDRNHRLIGERTDQFNFALAEWLNAAPRQTDAADRLAVAHERHTDHGAVSADPGIVFFLVKRVGQRIVDTGDPFSYGGAAEDRTWARRDRIFSFAFQVIRVEAVAGSEAVQAFLQPKNSGCLRSA